MEDIKKGTVIQSLQVGLSVLDLIAKHEQPMSFTDICEQSQITKSNLYKYLNTLTLLGLLYRDKKNGTYILGSKLIEYGMLAANQENLVDRVTPYLHEISRECSETALLSVWTANGPMVVQIVHSNQGVYNIGAQLGTCLPLQSSSGKTFAAFADQAQIEEWKEEEMKKLPFDRRKELENEINIVQEQQISFARDPLIPSVSSIAVPIFNFKKKLLGVLTMVGFSKTIPEKVEDPVSQYLLKVGQELSEGFGYVQKTQFV